MDSKTRIGPLQITDGGALPLRAGSPEPDTVYLPKVVDRDLPPRKSPVKRIGLFLFLLVAVALLGRYSWSFLPGPPRPPEEAIGNGPADGRGIAWFATWDSGLREAQRTGKPILLVAAAPHCAGVSGVW
jgi:hypothetical protein